MERRSKAVNPGEETQRIKKLDILYMSEESSEDDDGEIIVHRPQWRSESMSFIVFLFCC